MQIRMRCTLCPQLLIEYMFNAPCTYPSDLLCWAAYDINLALALTYSLSCLSTPQEKEDKIEQINGAPLLHFLYAPSNRKAKYNIAAERQSVQSVSCLFLV